MWKITLTVEKGHQRLRTKVIMLWTSEHHLLLWAHLWCPLWSHGEVKWSHSVVSDSEIPWTAALQAPPSMGFSRQEYWSGLPFPSPRDLSDPGIEPASPTLWADALSSEPPGNQEMTMKGFLFIIIFLNFTILYWFCHTLTWIRHGCTCVPHPESPSHLSPHPILLGHSSCAFSKQQILEI